MKKAIYGFALMACAVALVSAQSTNPAGAPQPLGLTEDVKEQLSELGFRIPNQTVEAPDFTLESLDGESRSLSSYRGKLVFLNFWATWCPPCRAEMPSMQTLYDTVGTDDFEIVAVNLQEGAGPVQDFVDEHGYTYPVLLDSSGRTGGMYGVRAIPSTFLIDRDGTLLGMFVGGREWDTPEALAFFEQVVDG
jgi:peroxiredoxin